MKASMILAATGASMAVAGPLDMLKRAWHTDVIIKWTTVTVTEGAIPAATHHQHTKATTHVTLTTTASAISSAEPTTEVAPQPETTLATSVVAESETSTVVVVPTTSSEAVVEVAAASTTKTSTTAAAATTKTSTTAAAATTVAAAGDDYESIVLYHHNVHRQNHSAPSVEYGSTYAGYAATVAASCKFAHDLTPGGGGYGQNIAASGGSAYVAGSENSFVPKAISNMWYNGEVNLYPSSNYGSSSPDTSGWESWGHFSQVVWVGTTQVGCATQFCAAGTIYSFPSYFTVCNYYPAGNVAGAYGKNILAPLNEATVSG